MRSLEFVLGCGISRLLIHNYSGTTLIKIRSVRRYSPGKKSVTIQVLRLTGSLRQRTPASNWNAFTHHSIV